MFNYNKRGTQLIETLNNRVLVLSEAVGTTFQSYDLSPDDFGGEEYEGCNENVVLTAPQYVERLHKSFLEAGADIIVTNSFGSTPLVLDEYGLGAKAHEISKRAAEIARSEADKISTPEKPRFVAGSMGPTTKCLSVTGGITFDELIDNFYTQAKGLYEGGVDYFLVETSQDTRNIKAALLAIDRLHKETEFHLPVAVSGTIETMGTLLAGQTAEAFAVSLEHRDLLYIGLNCATGPEFMTDHIRSLVQVSPHRIACVPNAGLPDEDGNYLETPEMMARALKAFGERKWLNIIGGCCGTRPDHAKAFAEIAKSMPVRKPEPLRESYLSGVDFLEVSEDVRPVLVGERTNVIGSRKFKRLIQEGKLEEAAEIGRKQVKGGAAIVDVCLADPDREELEDMEEFLDLLIKKVTAPLMIDSTDPEVIERALTYSQGKAIINSINLEDGEERFDEVCPLLKSFGAAVVVGCIDDDPKHGMAVTVERKIEVAQRSYDLLTKKFGIPAHDIYWDALVFPCGTGDENYAGSAALTIEGVQALKEKFPGTKIVLGVSNVSFGLPPAGREVLNSVFLYHCVQAGLDLALVNTEKIIRYAQIPEEEKKLCDDLIWNRGKDPIGAFNKFYGIRKVREARPKKELPLEERLASYVIEGTKDGLIPDLDEALKKMRPLQIVNGPLMQGMDTVGKLFGENKLIVAEVLQSAESMKAAVAHLEPHMEKSESSSRGTMVLATVKGDVHDIGKNLVDIILSNNGFKIINLGIKVPPQDLIQAVREHKPQIVGLSGLLVKSAQQMVITANDMAEAGIDVPILVGGAALTKSFTDRKIAKAYTSGFVDYAKDAMTGLELSKKIVDEKSFEELRKEAEERRRNLKDRKAVEKKRVERGNTRSKSIPIQESPPTPPDFERHLISPALEQVWPYMNPMMIYSRHLGIKGAHTKALFDSKKAQEFRDLPEFQKAQEIQAKLQEVQQTAKEWMKARAVYRFYTGYSEANQLNICEGGKKLVSWEFKRQAKEDGLCLSDLINPKIADEPKDSLAVFVTTVEGPVKEKAEIYKEQGEFLKSHILLALALETAEATAEYVHGLIRSQWGFPDSPDMNMMDRFQAKYRGKRYSFGYPACPELEYQEQLFELMKPSDIGVELTEGHMMSPEHSVSAVVFSHPKASYFGVGSS